MTRTFAASLAALAVAAVTSAGGGKSSGDVWTGGDQAKLAADRSDCQKEVDDLDVNQAANYSDSRYGVTAAMAEAVSQDNPLIDQGPVIRRAAFVTCMTDKGWKLE